MKPKRETTKPKHLVVGVGEIGQAIKKVLLADSYDIKEKLTNFHQKRYDVLHVCFPYSKKFNVYVKEYEKRFSPNLLIIHSTVPVGTSSFLNAVHSPCRGLHPNLEKATRTFVKYFGGTKSKEAAKYFEMVGIKTKCTGVAENTEALKLWDTTIYGWNIILEKFIYSYCKKLGLDFDLIYTDANRTYNQGYENLSRPQYKKYIIKHVDGKIGGHCVIPNLKLLSSDVSKIIKKYNKFFA